MNAARLISAEELVGLVIEPSQFVADTAAFVDVRLEGSAGKASYSFIGPGVSQNRDQTINIATPHGFNVGAASMPHGVVNNPHLHYTAEVFLCTRGRWQFAVGDQGDQTFELGAKAIFSAPTWVFRGFTNIGADDGWLFVVLGGDDTGGILWAPDVLTAAAATGLHLAPDHSVIDAAAGDFLGDTIAPMTEADLAHVDVYTDAELAERRVSFDHLGWSDQALLASTTEDGAHRCALAPVIGHGMTEDRRQRPPIANPHGFSIEWLAVEPGSSTGGHRLAESQVLFLVEGRWSIEVNGGADVRATSPDAGSIVSIPPTAWRNLVNTGDETAYAIIVNGGDGPKRIEWDDEITKSAAAAGWGCDIAGYLAPMHLLGRSAHR